MLGVVVTLCVTPGPAELLSLHAAALCLIVSSQQPEHNCHLSPICQTSPVLQTAALKMIGGTATAQEQGVGFCVRPLEVSLLSTISVHHLCSDASVGSSAAALEQVAGAAGSAAGVLPLQGKPGKA